MPGDCSRESTSSGGMRMLSGWSGESLRDHRKAKGGLGKVEGTQCWVMAMLREVWRVWGEAGSSRCCFHLKGGRGLLLSHPSVNMGLTVQLPENCENRNLSLDYRSAAVATPFLWNGECHWKSRASSHKTQDCCGKQWCTLKDILKCLLCRCLNGEMRIQYRLPSLRRPCVCFQTWAKLSSSAKSTKRDNSLSHCSNWQFFIKFNKRLKKIRLKRINHASLLFWLTEEINQVCPVSNCLKQSQQSRWQTKTLILSDGTGQCFCPLNVIAHWKP